MSQTGNEISANAKPAVLVEPPRPALSPLLSAYDIVHWPTDRKDVTIAVAAGAIGMPEGVYDALPNLKTIVCASAGVDAFDLAFLKSRGIALVNTTGVNHEDVADVALGLIIGAVRRFAHGMKVVATGTWNVPLSVGLQPRLRGRKLGIVGLGAIGQALAPRAAACGMEIAWFGPRPKPDIAWRYEPDLKKLAQWADTLAICVRSGPDVVGLVTADIIDALGPDGVIVNVSRGSVIDEDAMIAALKAGRLYGVGLDVFAQEPTPPERWADLQNALLLPHIGGTTRESVMATAAHVIENVRRHFAGEPLINPLV